MAGKRGIYIEFIGDEIKYVRSAENVMSVNTRLGSSYTRVGVDATKGAEAQVAAAVAANRALREQATNLRALAATSTGEKQAAALTLAAEAERKLGIATGVSTVATSKFAAETRTAERDFGKLTRGALAGAGIFSGLGRSLAFASGGFLIFATGATLIRRSVDAATALAATQRQVDKQLQTSGKSWGQYGERINAVDLRLSHVSGFTNQELLQSFGYLVRVTGNVSTALKLNATAADVARGRHIDLASASLALGKALGGSVTALRRLGIVVPKTMKGMEALNYVQQKFAGQAEAGATFQDKLNATLVDSEEIIGTALLPTVTNIATRFGDWLQKMNETGRLQKDVNTILHDAGVVIHVVTGAVGALDKVTGSFLNTLKLIVELKFATMVAGWISSLTKLAAGWVTVEGAASAAASAEARAVGAGAAGGVGGGAALAAGEGAAGLGIGAGLAGIRSRYRVRKNLPSVFGEYTSEGGQIGAAATAAETKVMGLRGALLGLNEITVAAIVIPIAIQLEGEAEAKLRALTGNTGKNTRESALISLLGPGALNPSNWLKGLGPSALTTPNRAGFTVPTHTLLFNPNPLSWLNAFNTYNNPAWNSPPFPKSWYRGNFAPPAWLRPGGTLGMAAQYPGGLPRAQFPFGVKAQPQWTSFELTAMQQIGIARATLTKSSKDDVAAAKKALVYVKRKIDEGNLTWKAMLQAIQVEAGLVSTIQSAAAAAAAKRAAAAAKAKQIASSYTIPLNLQIAQVQADMTTSSADDVKVLQQIIAAARKVLATGKKNRQGRLAVLQVIDQAQQAMDQIINTFTLPLNLQLGLARATAFGGDTRKWLLRMKAALLKALKAAKGNVELQINILDQIASINSQLNAGLNDAQAALGLFKQANLKKLTAGLGLTAAQRQALQARLSQLGPGGTVPGQGTGAAGYAINPDTGRPIVVHTHVHMDGKQVATSTTKHQQRRRQRNPKQSRGPHAGTAAA